MSSRSVPSAGNVRSESEDDTLGRADGLEDTVTPCPCGVRAEPQVLPRGHACAPTSPAVPGGPLSTVSNSRATEAGRPCHPSAGPPPANCFSPWPQVPARQQSNESFPKILSSSSNALSVENTPGTSRTGQIQSNGQCSPHARQGPAAYTVPVRPLVPAQSQAEAAAVLPRAGGQHRAAATAQTVWARRSAAHSHSPECLPEPGPSLSDLRGLALFCLLMSEKNRRE